MRFKFPYKDIMVMNEENIIGDDERPESGARWKLAFDGASNAMGHRIEVVLISPISGYTPFATRLCFECMKNMEE